MEPLENSRASSRCRRKCEVIGALREMSEIHPIGFKLAIFAMRFLEGMFFTGLAGCTLVVILSWISVGKDSFSRKE